MMINLPLFNTLYEIWRNIEGYEGRYQISNQGRVKSFNRYVRNNRDGRKRFVKGRILANYIDRDNYLIIKLFKCNKGLNHKIHRLVLTTFNRKPRSKEQGNHKDGNKQNNFILNLEWCSNKENCLHKIHVLGKHTKGEKHGNSKLTNIEVQEIKMLLKEDNTSQRSIATRYNVHFSIISSIKNNKTWKHIKCKNTT